MINKFLMVGFRNVIVKIKVCQLLGRLYKWFSLQKHLLRIQHLKKKFK